MPFVFVRMLEDMPFLSGDDMDWCDSDDLAGVVGLPFDDNALVAMILCVYYIVMWFVVVCLSQRVDTDMDAAVILLWCRRCRVVRYGTFDGMDEWMLCVQYCSMIDIYVYDHK
jgi:hypothetical protein